MKNLETFTSGNEAVQSGDYQTGMQYYCKLLLEETSEDVLFNLSYARMKFLQQHQEIGKSVALCGWELPQSSLDRIRALHAFYSDFYTPELLVSIQSSTPDDLRRALDVGKARLRPFSFDIEGNILQDLIRLVAANSFTFVHVMQPRPINIIMGVLYKLIWDARVILDIEKDELKSACATTSVNVQAYVQEYGSLPPLRNSSDKIWIRLAAWLANEFDGTTISQEKLRQKDKDILLPTARQKNDVSNTASIRTLLYCHKKPLSWRLIRFVENLPPLYNFLIPVPETEETRAKGKEMPALRNDWVYTLPEAELLYAVRKYNAQKKNRKATVALFTAIIDNYDPLIIPETIVDDWDYIVFTNTDIPGEHPFEVRKVDLADMPRRMAARYIKTHPHVLLQEYDYVVWIDSNILVRGAHLTNLVKRLQSENIPMLLHKHPDRKCLYEESRMCIHLKKDSVQKIEKQIQTYRNEGMPENFGLPETGILLRNNKNHNIQLFNDLWWDEMARHSVRDQISVMYVIWKHNIPFEFFDDIRDIRQHENNDYCLFLHGGKVTRYLPPYSQPFFSSVPPRSKTNAPENEQDAVLLESVRRYWRLKADKKNSVVVYTAFTNNYDVLKIPQSLCPDFDYVCFTDRAAIEGEHPWQIRPLEYFSDSTRTARFVKTHPHLFFPEYEVSVWIDTNILIRTDALETMVDSFIKSGHLFGAIPHPKRDCTYDEGDICSKENKDVRNIIKKQMASHRNQGFPNNFGLIESNLLIRRHNMPSVRTVNENWWSGIFLNSKRDQLSIMPVLWKAGLRWTPLMKRGRSTRNHTGFACHQHGLKYVKERPAYRVPRFLPASFAYDRAPFWATGETEFHSDSLRKFEDIEVDIVICVHNALHDVANCLDSVEKCRLPSHGIVIVNDGSDEETTKYLDDFAAAQPRVRMVHNTAAIGYTKAANQGLRLSSAPFIILLNSDTIVSRNWTLKLLQTAYSRPYIGIVGPMSNAASFQSIPYIREGLTKKLAVNDLPSQMSVDDMDQWCEKHGYFGLFPLTHLINGFCYGIKREVIDRIGYLDEESFPVGYGEEDDYSMRAQSAGFMHAIATHCYVYHAKSKSFGAEKRNELAFQGGKKLQEKHGVRAFRAMIETSQANPLLQMLRYKLCQHLGIPFVGEVITRLGLPETTAPELATAAVRPADRPEVMTTQLEPETVSVSLSLPPKPEVENPPVPNPSVYQPELSLAQLTKAEHDENMRFTLTMRHMKHGIPRTALWILPAFRNVLAGGIRTLLTAMEDFSQSWGTHNTLALYKTTPDAREVHEEIIRASFPHLQFTLAYIDPSSDIPALPACDIGICSSWPTAYALAKYNKCRAKFYFMQDYESLFYPAGSVSALINQTYKFGFYCIANTVGIADQYRKYSNLVDYFVPGVDRKIFYPDTSPKAGGPWQIVFYGRPNNQRNAFALGLESLKRVKEHFKDNVSILSVGGKWKPDNFGVYGIVKNLGVLGSMEEIAELYRKSHLGLVFMLTPHPSYQPLEYMASGCVTVTNDNPETAWLFKDHRNAVLTSVLPNEVADTIISTLENKSLMGKVRAGGLETAATLDWEKAKEKIRSYIANPEGEPNDSAN